MLELLPYHPALGALAGIGGLLVLQLLIYDVTAIRARQPPGAPVPVEPGRFLFRAFRAHANTNETLGAFIALLLAAILLGAPPAGVNGLAGAYLLTRVGHMACYYAHWSLARSVAFGLSLLTLLGLLGLAIVAYLG